MNVFVEIGFWIDRLLSRFDSPERELVVRRRVWVMTWFPYRTAEFMDFDEQTGDLILGPWKWNQPHAWKRTGLQRCGSCKRLMLHHKLLRAPLLRRLRSRMNCGGDCLRCIEEIEDRIDRGRKGEQ